MLLEVYSRKILRLVLILPVLFVCPFIDYTARLIQSFIYLVRLEKDFKKIKITM